MFVIKTGKNCIRLQLQVKNACCIVQVNMFFSPLLLLHHLFHLQSSSVPLCYCCVFLDGRNCNQMYASDGIGASSGHLVFTCSLKSRTEIALAKFTNWECLWSSTAVPTSSSRNSLALLQNKSNFELPPAYNSWRS